MSPLLALELVRLLLADAERAVVRERLSREPEGPSLEAVLALGERARRAGASEEQAVLALGLLSALPAEEAAPERPT